MKKFLSWLTAASMLAMLAAQSLTAFAEVSADMYAEAEAEALMYSDVDEGHLYLEAIGHLTLAGVVSGDSEGDTFRPDGTLNRAEMVKILVEASGESTASAEANCFNDVPEGEWFTPYVCTAADLGWVVGYEDGTVFRPSQPVTFVEGLKMTLEAMAIAYDEDSDPALWYRTVVNAAAAMNYIPFDVHAFHGDLMRGQMADMITRIMMDMNGEAELDAYLGARAEIMVTYDTIEMGEDLSYGYDEPTTEEGTQMFDILVTNTSDMVTDYEMNISPGIIVIHDCSVDLVETGVMATAEWEALAEWGDPSGLMNMETMMALGDYIHMDTALMPGESTLYNVFIPFEEIETTCASVARMAGGTNDAVVVGKVMFSEEMMSEAEVMVYDMGTEENSAINSGFEGGQPDGTRTEEENMNNGTATDPWADIMMHPQFDGVDAIMSVETGVGGTLMTQ